MTHARRATWGTYHDGTPYHYGHAIHVANPWDKGWNDNRCLVTFGSGCWLVKAILVYGSIDDSLEIAAEFAQDNGWDGLVIPLDSSPEDLGLDKDDDPWECEDLIYTESGWVSAHETHVTENPSNDFLRLIHFKGERRK